MSTVGRWFAFWVIVISCLGFVGYVAVAGTRSGNDAQSVQFVAPRPVATRSPTIALFIGDSYTAGTSTIDQSATFASQACNRRGWVCYFDAQPATGYLANGDGSTGQVSGAYPARLRSDRIYLPNVVVVSGGRADLGSGAVSATATTYFEALKRQFPTAKLVVLEPFWPSSTPPSSVLALQAAVRTAAQTAGAVYVPTAGWLTPRLVGPDGVTPTQAGHRVMGYRLAVALA